jgi:uncharacterized protein YrzB (UPF0473 family)
MLPSPYPNDNEKEEEIVTLTDEKGRSLSCTIEYSIEIEEKDYVLLLPVDTPVEIFTWHDDEDDDDDAAVFVEDDEEIDTIFDTAKVVLEEQNLKLQRTAVTLTVSGELPEFEDEEELIDTDDNHNGESDYEELMLLARFYHEEQEYAVYTPLDPFFLLARMKSNGKAELLSDEERERIEPLLPMLEDQLFDELD